MPQPDERPLSVGIIGLAHLHPRSYMQTFGAMNGLRVVAASDPNPALLKAFTSEFRLAGYSSYRDMLLEARLDLAAVFLPHAECPDAVVECAAQGVHVLVEKPMAASSDGVRRMIAASLKAGTLLSPPYVWRYHPVARKMKQMISEGLMGRIIGCEGRCAAGRPHRYIQSGAGWMLQKAMSGGGPMINLGVHWIDLYRWLLGDEVVEVVGKNVKVNESFDIEDNSFALVTFSRGTVLALDISYTVPDAYPSGRDLYLSLRGTGGVMSWSPAYEGIAEELFVSIDAPESAAVPGHHLTFELDSRPGYSGVLGYEYMQDLAHAIRAGSPPPITADDGLRALEVVEAIYQSAESGRAVRLATPHS